MKLGKIEKMTVNLYSCKPHFLSKILPPVFGQDLEALRNSIHRIGKPINPVVLYENAILDGNQRIYVCRELRIHQDKIPYEVFEGNREEALQKVWDLNFARRHLNAGQRAVAVKQYFSFLVVGDVEAQKDGGTNVPPVSNVEAAKKAQTSTRPIKEAKFVAEHSANPKKVFDEVMQGKRTLHNAFEETKSKLPEDKLGTTVPPAALPYWERREEISDILHHASALRVAIKKIRDGDPLYARIGRRGEMVREVDSIFNQFQGILPSYVCGYCEGQVGRIEKCAGCNGTGVLSVYFDKSLPPEKRANASTRP